MDLFDIKSLFEQKEKDPTVIFKLLAPNDEHYKKLLGMFNKARKNRKENKNG